MEFNQSSEVNEFQITDHVHFVVDYRSPPTGIGTVFTPDGKTYLITTNDCGPENMRQARIMIKKDYLPTEVIFVDSSGMYNDILDYKKLNTILSELGVQYISDSELMWEFDNHSDGIFTLTNWIENVKSF